MPGAPVLDLLLALRATPAPERQRTIEAVAQALDRTADPLTAAALILMTVAAISEQPLAAWRRASMKISRPSLRAMVVRALDTDWDRVADPRAEMERLFGGLAPEEERDLIQRLFDLMRIDAKESLKGPAPPPKNAVQPATLRYGVPAPVGQRAKPPAPGEAPPARVVNSGFVDAAAPTTSVVESTLGCGRRYYFWLDVGARRPDSIERVPTPLPPLPVGAELRVVVFGFPDQLEIDREGRLGVLQLEPDGSSVVIREASAPQGLEPEARRRSLYFAVRTPAGPGHFALRCCLYHKQNLLQSRLVTARVTAVPERDPTALASEIDYAVSYTLDPTRFTALAEQRLSIMLNDNPNGTHGLRVVGAGDFVGDCELSEAVIRDATDLSHSALHLVAWGEEVPWEQSKKKYHYDAGPGAGARLGGDLIDLARAGAKLAYALVYTLAQKDDVVYDRLRALVREPASVQLALKRSANHVLPAALIYDKPIDSQRDDLRICERFTADLDGPGPIADGVCLSGRCPSWADKKVVCPSGFWGFRHRLGIPLSPRPGMDAPVDIPFNAEIDVGMYVSTDFAFAEHGSAIRAARAGVQVTVADDRDEALALLLRAQQIVYFYCHGGYTAKGFPTLFVGGSKQELAIAAENLEDVRWTSPQPLVILNGCHTTTFAQRQMLDFVEAFVVRSHAAGVIGTEITVFESLARPFAEECLGAFLAGAEIGEAVRRARLAVLQKHRNPLGLVYVPYVANGVRLVQQSRPAAP